MKRIVVKVGSQVLCEADGSLNIAIQERLVSQVAELRSNGWQLLLVSSGAVAAGKASAHAERLIGRDAVTRKQVLAATGQVRLMQTYHELFENHGLSIAQVLTSKSDFQTRRHYLNMRNCIEGILDAGIVPVVNENDVVSITELMFTDNDELAGLLAAMVNADLLCLLSSVDGVFDQTSEGSLIPEWDADLHNPEEIVTAGTSQLGRGGMHSKIQVAQKAANLGTEVVICNGHSREILLEVVAGAAVGTRFTASLSASPARRWLANAEATGLITVNSGAAEALTDPDRLASVLLVGIDLVEGEFKKGDVVRILGPDKNDLAIGRAEYDADEARKLAGQQGLKPLVHYDYLYRTN